MGNSTVNNPSRFLKDIPANLIKNNGNGFGHNQYEERTIRNDTYSWERTVSVKANVATPAVELPDLKAGDRVKHSQFGEGTVVSCKPVNNDSELVVAFPSIGIKRLLLSFARLEKME
jgi:DNA helicase-2/ATP-dependent DNA helicase PcrA